MASTVAICLASSIGLRVVVMMTAVPIRMSRVTAAT